MAESFTAHGPSALQPGDRHLVTVHIDERVLRDETQDGRSEIDQTAAIPPATVRRLCCDGSLVPIIEDAQGTPLSVGRKTRAIPPAIRRALDTRDAGCRYPGCTNTRYVDAHHIHHWSARICACRKRRTARRYERRGRSAPRRVLQGGQTPSVDRWATSPGRSRLRWESSVTSPPGLGQRHQKIRQRRRIGTRPDLQACRADLQDNRRVTCCLRRRLAHYTRESHRLVPRLRLAVTLQATRPPVQRRGGVVLVGAELGSTFAARPPGGYTSRPFSFVRHARELAAAGLAPLHGCVQRTR